MRISEPRTCSVSKDHKIEPTMSETISKPRQAVIAKVARRSLGRVGQRVIDFDVLPANGQSRPHRLGMADTQVEDRVDIGASRPLIENGILSRQSA